MILAVLIARFITEPPPPDRSTAQEETAHDMFPLALLRVRNIWLCCAICGTLIGSLVQGAIFFPLYFVNVRDFAPEEMGRLMAVLGLCPVVGGVLVPWISDRIGRRTPIIFFAAITALCPLFALTFQGSTTVLATLMVLSWIGVGATPLIMGVVPAESVSPRLAATAIGLVIGIGELLGGVVAPIVAGWAADRGGLAMPLMIAVGLSIVAGVISLGLKETKPRLPAGEPATQIS